MSDKVYISLGCACITKEVLKELNLTIDERLPFDWCGTDSSFVSLSLSTDFRHWNDINMFYVCGIHAPNNHLHIKHRLGHSGFIHDVKAELVMHESQFSNYYDREFAIPTELMKQFVESYQRRIDRFRKLVNSNKKIVFIWHNYLGDMTTDIKNLWIGLNAFTRKPFTLICIHHTNGIEPDRERHSILPNVSVYFDNKISRCLVGTYFCGNYDASVSKEVLKGIISEIDKII